MNAREKAIKLLKIAKDQEGTPEGDNAQAMAEALMEKHGIEIEEEDLEDAPSPNRIFFESHPEIVPWREMLLLTLCDVVHGGLVMTLVGHDGQWQLWIVDEEVEVHVDSLRTHYDYLCQRIENLISWKETRGIRHYDSETQEHHMRSFALGALVHVCTVLVELLTEEEGAQIDQDDLPFVQHSKAPMLQAGTTAPKADPPSYQAPQVDPDKSFERQLESAQEVFRQATGADANRTDEADPPSSTPDEEEDRGEKVHVPDPFLFEQGLRMARSWIGDDVIPDEVLSEHEDGP